MAKKEKPKDEDEITDFKRSVSQVKKHLKESVPDKYKSSMITHVDGVVFLKKYDEKEFYHELVPMGDDSKCIQRIIFQI